MREIGIVKWFGARDRRGSVYGFIHNMEKDEDIHVGSSHIECEPEMLKKGVVVSYQETQQRQTNKKSAIQVRLIADETDPDVLERCFQSQEVQIWLAISSRYLNSLSVNTAIEKIEKKAEAVRDIYYRKRLIESIPDTVIYSLLAGNLRKLLLSKKKRLDVLARLILENEIDLLKAYDIESEVEELLGSLDNFHADNFFNQVKNIITYNGFMWHLATENIKKDVIRNHYQGFFCFIDTYTNKVIEFLEMKKNTIEFECSSIYRELDKEDWQLGELWAKSESSTNKEFIIAKMISARGAEKVAQIFFKSLGFKSVKDVAILQLSNNEEDWRMCDLIIDNQFFIDVKNTRTSRNNRGMLSEICVPKFKCDRNSNEVVILGVISPYLKLSEIKGYDSTSRYFKTITIIGQVTQSTIHELKQQYESSFLEITISRLSKETYLPAWVFDYSTDFYKPFDDIRQSISPSFVEIPSLEEIKMLDYDQPLSIMIQFDLDLPIQWKSSLHIWEQEFYDRLLMRKRSKENNRLYLPDIFLEILSHFLQMLHNENDTYHPREYSKLFFYTKDGKPYLLNIIDPFDIISKLIGTLVLLWDNRQKAKIAEFRIFKFNSQGILQGKRSRDELHWTTIIAYCGGSIYNKQKRSYEGKCLNQPLILGHHQVCEKCGKLICNRCSFCSEGCTALKNKCINNFDLSCPEDAPF